MHVFCVAGVMALLPIISVCAWPLAKWRFFAVQMGNFMSGVFAALGCKRIMVLSGNHLRSQNNFHVFCVAGVIVHIYLCAWRSPNVDFFLPGVCSLLWHACVLLKHNSLFRSTSHLQNLSSVQQVVCVSCPLCLCICIYSCKSVLYITYMAK